MGAAALLAFAPALRAQSSYRVYQWETLMDGWAEPNLWDTFVTKSDRTSDHFGRTTSLQGASLHSFELDYGITDRFQVGGYADFVHLPGMGFKYARARLDGIYRFSDRYTRVFNPALYVEYYAPRGKYDPNELEMRLILEHDFEDLRLDLNPTVTKQIGADTATKMQAELSSGLYYRRFYAVQPGIELYDKFGALGSSPGVKKQQHILFPTLTFRWAKAFTWNVGVGFGLTPESDKVTVKSILSYEFQTVRPSNQAH